MSMILNQFTLDEKQFNELINQDEDDIFDRVSSLVDDNDGSLEVIDFDQYWPEFYRLISGNDFEEPEFDELFFLIFGKDTLFEEDYMRIAFNKDNIEDITESLNSLNYEELIEEDDSLEDEHLKQLLNQVKNQYNKALNDNLYVICFMS